MEKYASMGNTSKFPFVELLSDDEVKRELETQLSEHYPNFRVIEWEAHDLPMSFGKRIITCKFEIEVN